MAMAVRLHVLVSQKHLHFHESLYWVIPEMLPAFNGKGCSQVVDLASIA